MQVISQNYQINDCQYYLMLEEFKCLEYGYQLAYNNKL